MEYFGLHNNPKAEVHLEHLLMGPKEEEQEEEEEEEKEEEEEEKEEEDYLTKWPRVFTPEKNKILTILVGWNKAEFNE
jgi:hypothetical protein